MHISASDSSSDCGRLARDVMQRFFVADRPGELPVAVEEVRAQLPGARVWSCIPALGSSVPTTAIGRPRREPTRSSGV
jgi:hypothetical protein